MTDKVVEFNGKIYELVGKYYFEKNSTNAGRRNAKQLHIAVWEFYNKQEVPKGCHIHHKDFNHLNNDISNLECLPIKEHLSLHAKTWWSKEENRKKGEKHLYKIREKANEWHKSKEGLAWHREHAKYFKNWQPKTLNCEYCGKEFVQQMSQQRFCSYLCADRKRRGFQGIGKEVAKCEFCGKEFVKTTHNKRFCSEKCANRKKNGYIGETTGTCLYCGKIFTKKRRNTKYCCSNCRESAKKRKTKG